ncbi:hypothetical protein PRUPE_7G191400 [Prunus persica]|uniref:RBR-type E3 ubiquitin transferase n=1 Tax=Prunus persica TaxID=3760 RepID=A0A251NDQ4_PRUPE|nr:ATP-dependent RNA helicase DEAH12, chloroplastic [Prunus persica]ONH97465.1 hypothetical protein PRUPE_7G191400 [Prunus persica]
MGNIICRGKNLDKQVLGGKQLGNKIGTLMTKHSKHMKEKKQVGDIDPNFVCRFCHEQVHQEHSFNIKGCAHFYCQECIVKFIVSNLQNNVTCIMCPTPGCSGLLDPEYCRPILPNDVFDLWGTALCESLLETEHAVDSTFTCDFCVEQIELKDSFNIKGCAHFYCQECIVRFIVSKLQDNVTSVTCPNQGCPGVLDLEYCRRILPYDVFHRWGKALCESVVMEPQKKYLFCPFNACSTLLIDEEPDDTKQAQCPHCKRVFCVKCKVPWHTEFDCDMFQKLRDRGEDQQLEELAKNKNWRRCPSCKYYVERRDGCSYIKCRCGNAFCYNCGVQASLTSHTRHCPSCHK